MRGVRELEPTSALALDSLLPEMQTLKMPRLRSSLLDQEKGDLAQDLKLEKGEGKDRLSLPTLAMEVRFCDSNANSVSVNNLFPWLRRLVDNQSGLKW
jgi:hypothetical protein